MAACVLRCICAAFTAYPGWAVILDVERFLAVLCGGVEGLDCCGGSVTMSWR
jgi:hypothetical protein